MKEIKYCLNHTNKKVYSKGLCRKCYEKNLIDNNPEYKNRQLENTRNWILKNKERKALTDKEYRKNNPKSKDQEYYRHLRYRFKMSEEDYLKLVEKSNNKCYICYRSPHEGKRLHLDHNHNTNEVRGLLCTRCNWYLHTVENDYSVLDRIKNYLKI